MMKMIKIQTILLALLVNMTVVVFGQDGQNTAAVVEDKAGKETGAVQRDILATKSVQKAKSNQTLEFVEKAQDLNNSEKSLLESIKEFYNIIIDFIENNKTAIWVSLIAEVIILCILFFLKKLKIIKKLFVFLYSIIACNSYFCKDKFAKQLPKKKKLSPKASTIEKIKNKYIHLQSGGYPVARSILFPNNIITVDSGIYIICGKQLSGRQAFLENELVKHNADVFEIDEDKWLEKKREKVETIINELLAKRLFVLCRKWKLSFWECSHKVIILMGESLNIDELRLVIQSLLAILEKMTGTLNTINHKNLTLIIKTNIRRLNDIYLNEIKTINPSIKIAKLEFDLQNPIYTLQMFQDSNWEQKDLQLKIESELQKSQFYHQVTLSNGDISLPLATALYVNTFGLPNAINNLYQMEAVKDNVHWQNIFNNWKISCDNHNIPLDKFLAFLWLIAILRRDNDKTKASNIYKRISHGNVEDERWLAWEGKHGLSSLLQEILGDGADDTFDFLGNNTKQLNVLEWAAFIIKIMKGDDTFTYPVQFTNVQKQIHNNLPYALGVLGGDNDKTWGEYKKIIAGNLIDACIQLNRRESRDEVLNLIVNTLKQNELYNGEDCTRIEEIADEILQIKKDRKYDFSLFYFIEENWERWSAYERNDFLNTYLCSKSNDTDYLKALVAILPLLVAKKISYSSLNPTNARQFIGFFTQDIDLIFDLRDEGQLGRVFNIQVEKLSPDDKIRKYIAMKVLEIIFNTGHKFSKIDSYMGGDWQDKPYINVSLGDSDNPWTKFITVLAEIDMFDGYLLSKEEKISQLTVKLSKLQNLLNEKEIFSSTIFTDMKRLANATFINITINKNYYYRQLLDYWMQSNFLLSDDYFSDYIQKINNMHFQIECVILNNSFDKNQISTIDTGAYNVVESIVFLVLVNYFQNEGLLEPNDDNRENVEYIYHEFFKYINNVNNINTCFFELINRILINIPGIIIRGNIISSTTITQMYKLYQDFIYSYLVRRITSTIINETLYNYNQFWNLFTSHTDQNVIKDNMLNKLYLSLSRAMILAPNDFQYLYESNQCRLEKLQSHVWHKKLSQNLGELVYQQMAWIFDNHNSLTDHELSELHGQMDDVYFFQCALQQFKNHKSPQDIKSFEEIAFMCTVIATIIRAFQIYNYNNKEMYRRIFYDFINRDNSQLYQLLHKNLDGQECMQYLEFHLFWLEEF